MLEYLKNYNEIKQFRENAVMATGDTELIKKYTVTHNSFAYFVKLFETTRVTKEIRAEYRIAKKKYESVVLELKNHSIRNPLDLQIYRTIFGNLYHYYQIDDMLHVFCKKCKNIFEVSTEHHKSGYGCRRCCKNDHAYEFIPKAITVHGIRYCYEKVEYVNSRSHIVISCLIHGEFEQSIGNHLQGRNCSKCLPFYKSQEKFIEDARKIHGNKYDYSKVVYKNNRNTVIISCVYHGDFFQFPGGHLNGNGCKECSIDKRRKTTEQFIKDAIKVHKNEFDYSEVKYINNESIIIIICRIHGKFEQKANNHLNGGKCKKCIIEKSKKTTAQFIEESNYIHNFFYNYSEVNYINGKIKVIIICKIHGKFKICPNNHLQKQGCKKCGYELNSVNRRKTTEKFIEESKIVHNNLYDYSKTFYKKSNSKITVICHKHGEFSQLASDHLNKSGCPFCKNKTEGILKVFLEKHFETTAQAKFPWSQKKRYDFVIGHTIIELDGAQHFRQVANWQSPEIQRQNDINKTIMANANGYCVIRLLQEDVFNNVYDWQSTLLHYLRKPLKKNVYLYQNNEYDALIENLG